MRVLGIHDGHNASICLIEDGIPKFAIQEERLVNEKNKSGFPRESIKLLFKSLNLKLEDIDKVALASTHSSFIFASGEYFKRDPKKSLFRYQVKNMVKKTPLYSAYKRKVRKQRLQHLLDIGFDSKKILFVDHHLCHAATAYFGSHFPRDDKVLVLTNDGAGDGLCATVCIGEKGTLKRIAEVKESETLAGIYCLVTKVLGFKPLEHEYKLMGMAAYSSPMGLERGYTIFRDLVSISKTNPLIFEWNSSESISKLISKFQKDFNFTRFDWICAGLQKFTEEMLAQWVKSCMKETGLTRVALAGGIFMNVKANKRIMELNELEDLFVFPSCSDETISIGAAYHVYNQCKRENNPDIQPLNHFYLGDEFSDDDTLEQIKKFEKEFSFKYKRIEDIEREIAFLLSENQVVARCKGRMEFGARALGNRSILADPSSLWCVREINMMVKKRDFWMPFAPVILKERQHDYFINKKNLEAPYMILSFDTTENYNDFIAAVHQADLTARPQVIEKNMNPEYYLILKEFEKITGRGVLLNTSFNLHGFPIVRGPKEAIEVFRDSGLKYLALGNYLLEK